MKILTVLGTRPEIIRLSLLIPKLDRITDHVVVHTGQNYDPKLSDIFFEELGVRRPDHYLGIRDETFAAQVGAILVHVERVLHAERPDRLLILGDTNSGLAAFVAKRMGIPVYHMEAGNRCFDDRVPEEVNRRVIDHCSDILMPYTERSRQNLLRDGIASHRIFVTGNPIYEVLKTHEEAIARSAVLDRHGLAAGKYFVVTAHRAENVDPPERLRSLVASLIRIRKDYELPIIVSVHPRTRSKLAALDTEFPADGIILAEPFSFLDFVRLERDAFCVLTDSGTVQEECSILQIPNVTIRDVTERPETVECGSNVIAGVAEEDVVRGVRMAVEFRGRWLPPPEYSVPNVSDVAVKIISSYSRQ